MQNHPRSCSQAIRRPLRSITTLCIAACALFAPIAALHAQSSNSVWLEGETPTSVIPGSTKLNISGWGHPEYLSEGKWVQISIYSGDIDKQVPDTGIVLTYKFHSDTAGSRTLWDRVGYEYVRSGFEWRVDDGNWSAISPNQFTIDLMELQDWNEVAWLKMGTANISAGDHTLEIRLPKTKNSKGEWDKILYASDAICIADDSFRPNSKYKPGDMSWQTDRDRSADTQVYTAKLASDSQTATSLKGDWEIARWDEDAVLDRDQPVKSLPNLSQMSWSAIAVPSDRNTARPDLAFAHRVLYRTHVTLPAETTAHSWILHFPSINMLASVFVNGQLAGTCSTPFAVWDCDITRFAKPGQNEVVVAIKDSYYGLEPDRGKDAHTQFNLPYSFLGNQGVSFHFDFPVWNHAQAGILQEPTLVSAGQVFTADAFAKPSVANKSLGLELTLTNTGHTDTQVEVSNEIVPLGGSVAEKAFADSSITVPSGTSKTLDLTEDWANPKLWWPNSPQQYEVVTRIKSAGQTIDTRRTKFGFREWTWKGANFALNGIPWHGRADLDSTGHIESNDALLRKHGQNMVRVWGEDHWEGVSVPDALDFYDRTGMVVRRTGIFDGEGFNYRLVEDGMIGGKPATVPRRALFDNWDRQLVAWAKGQRNHPSIMIWSMENEITFINSHNGGMDPVTDPEMTKAAGLLAKLDPTRPQMTDGGNALLDQSLPVYGAHYMEAPLSSLPSGAYDIGALAHRQLWPITEAKPIFFGETYFANGIEPGDLATVGGEAAVIGKAEAHPAIGLIGKMMSEGYRWTGLSAFHFWLGGESDAYYNSWQPIAVLCRQWDWTFGSKQVVKRDLGIFNDTFAPENIRLNWTLRIGGENVESGSKLVNVPAGQDVKFPVELHMPSTTVRKEGQWILVLSVNGKAVYHDTKPVSVLPNPIGLFVPKAAVQLSGIQNGSHAQMVVFDPKNTLRSFVGRLGIPARFASNFNGIASSEKVVLVAADALDAASSTSTRLAAIAATGRAVIVLEQKNPLRFQALPIQTENTSDTGEIGFMEDPGHPVMRGLEQKDFMTWAGGTVYTGAYAKPTTGAKSLVECGPQLRDTALMEIPTANGIMLLSQLNIGHSLSTNSTAQHLLRNMIQYGIDYRPSHLPVYLYATNPNLRKAVIGTGVSYTPVTHLSDVLNSHRQSVLIVDAVASVLQELAANKASVDAFTNSGGWIILNGVAPEGLASYNSLVGVNHIIRPFRREKVTFAAIRNPLLAGLPAQNIVLGSGQQIFPWAAGQYPATDAFSYVVDYDDVAPFGKSTFFAYDNIVNNFTGADGWPLIINFQPPADGSPAKIPISLPRPETITQFTWIGNNNYMPTTKVALDFGAGGTAAYDVLPNTEPQVLPVSPARTAKDLTLEVVQWQPKPGAGGNIGIDNIYLKAKRSPQFYAAVKPMLNIGALMSYPKGKGGMVLCNVLFKESEAVPENADKKRAILAAILRNLKATFAGGKTIIAGGNLAYTPIDISSKANQYRNDQGWFGDKQFTFADLPVGKHVFAGVTYNVYNFTTSPVPTAVMLGGSGVPFNLPDSVTGIPVHKKADALFFLQAARIDNRRNGDELRNHKQFEMADYIVHYADGQTAKIPLLSEISVDDYHQATPSALPGAQLAWTKPYSSGGLSSAAYSMQWNNPRPETEIESIDLIYGPDRRGVPALLALTAASAP